MDLQTRKLRFIEEYIRLSDKNVLQKLEEVLRKEKNRQYHAHLKAMTPEELQKKIDRSEEDIKEGRMYVQEEVESYFRKKSKK